MTILLIDDDGSAFERLAAVLKQAGYDVVAAGTGKVGVRVGDDGSSELVAAGFRLPETSELSPPAEPPADPLVALVRQVGERAPAPSAAAATASREREVFECHAALRWARAILGLLDAQADPRTLHQWGRVIGAAPGTLRGWCRMAGVSPKASLLLARLLRAVSLAQSRGWSPEQLLDVVDRRTLTRILACGGLVTPRREVTIAQLMAGQSLVTDRAALEALQHLLAGRDGAAARRPPLPTAVPTAVPTAAPTTLPATLRTAVLTSDPD